MKKNYAFTLAEVLVTLGIIGVVSALTVPTLMKNHQKKVFVTQLHKVYSELEQAFEMEMNENNAVDLVEAGMTTKDSTKTFLQKRLKVLQVCPGIKAPCFVTNYKNLSGTALAFNNTGYSCGTCVSLANGAGVCVDRVNCYSSNYQNNIANYGYVFIDVNGPSGPNILGRDAFITSYFQDGAIDVYKATPACRQLGLCDGGTIDQIRTSKMKSCETSTAYTDMGCFGSIITNNWEMTY